MGALTFTGSAGAETVVSIYNAAGAVARRFANWAPSARSVGDMATQLSTGRIAAAFTYRTDYLVSFEMRNISPKGPSGFNMVSAAQRLIVAASIGAAITVDVEDDISTGTRYGYAVATPTLTLADPKLMLYTLSLTLVADTSASGPWPAIYSGARD